MQGGSNVLHCIEAFVQLTLDLITLNSQIEGLPMGQSSLFGPK